MNISPKRQQGLTLISLVFVLVLIAFFTLLVLKIVPIYIDHGKVVSALAALERTPNLDSTSEREIRGSLDKRLNMNYVYDVTQDDIKVIKYGNYLKVEIAYDKVEKIVGNLSILVEFDDVIEVGQK